MKRFSTLFTILAIFFLASSVNLLKAQNQVTNPGFENWTAGAPDDWTTGGGSITLAENNTDFHGGSASCDVVFTSQSNQDLKSASFNVTAGQEVNGSVWILDNDVAGRARISVLFDAGGNFYGDYSADDPAWQQLSFTTTVPAGATTATFQVRFYDVPANWDGDCNILVDDALFEANTSVNPEPTNYPTDFSLSVDRLDASISWTDAVGAQLPAGYILLGSTSDNISAPVDGTEIADDIDISDGSFALNISQGTEAYNVTMQNGMQFNQTYYFKIFPYTNSGNNIDFKTDGTAPSASGSTPDLTLVHQEFFPTDLGSWTAVSVIGDQVWGQSSYAGLSYADMSGYDNGALDNEDWLVSPALNLSTFSGVVFSFASAYNYSGPALELYYSTNYTGTGDPNNATWTSMTASWPATDGYTWANSGDVNISSNSSSFYLAFKYTSNPGAGSSKWEVTNLLVTASGGAANPATKLDITSINGGNPVYENQDFTVTVQAQDASGAAANVTSDVDVTLSLGTGTGTLGGTLTGTIASGSSSLTISGVSYGPHENGIVLNVSDDAGNLTAGNSDAFDVLEVVTANIVITEIMYKGMPGEDTLEYFEIYNEGSSAVNLENYEVTQGVNLTFGNESIDPGEYLLIAKNADAIQAAFGVSAIQWESGGLKNSGEDIEITDPNNNVVAYVDYGSGDPWPNTVVGTSITFCDPSADNNDPANWSLSVELLANIGGQDIYGSPLSGCGSAPLVADFEADNTDITAGESVNFSDLSIGNPTSWEWTFTGGNPASSTDQNPSNIVYDAPGDYDVSLTIHLGGDADTETKTAYIHVSNPNNPPVADFEADQTTIFVGQTVNFTDLSTNNPSSWAWTFDGGTPSSSTDQNPTVVYDAAGTYDVSLYVENGGGNDTETKTNYITVLPASVGDIVITEIMYNPPESGNDSLEYIELYNNSDNTVNLFSYEFNDGVSYIFPQVELGVSDILVVAKDSLAVLNTFGVTAYQWTSGSLSNGGETIKLVTPTGVLVDSVNYSDTDPWPVEADGDGPSITICDPSTENSVGDNWHASVHFLAVNANNDSIFGSPGMAPAPLANFEADVTSFPGTGGQVQFTDLSSCNADTYSWEFEGGTPATSSDTDPVVTYSTAGDFDVTLTVSNATGSNTLTMVDYIHVGVGTVTQDMNSISVIPNPSNGYFRIINPNHEEMYISVYNVLGGVIMEHRAIHGDDAIDLLSEKNGIYLLQMIVNGQKKTMRIIKQ